MKPKKKEIKEVIVVEGKDDISQVKRAVKAEIIATGGFSLPDRTLEQIKGAAQRKGIIILTDPDYPGEWIRREITKAVTEAKHAFIPKEDALKEGNVGIENASPQNILLALERARCELQTPRNEFTKGDLMKEGLLGVTGATEKRDQLGKILGIGYGNAKQFLNRLNHYGVTREEWQDALIQLYENSKRGEEK
ncbi:ribonuclease M5 [Isachenkonia alkalipeptolytica]|uniref:Ribonuclease M5 n=1 Tax=Isachenkonia alkalipeptolytica TaxID=2565777 RepID=A0AA43XMB6_9CLOT|nr:ribonuclease M5 [Isachenkonia alkalipeptolytica]NBG89071.1 ribonuclease M5 [Isachenkonia alkalipeptolytica]